MPIRGQHLGNIFVGPDVMLLGFWTGLQASFDDVYRHRFERHGIFSVWTEQTDFERHERPSEVDVIAVAESVSSRTRCSLTAVERADTADGDSRHS